MMHQLNAALSMQPCCCVVTSVMSIEYVTSTVPDLTYSEYQCLPTARMQGAEDAQ